MVCLDEEELFAEFDQQLQSRFTSAQKARLRYSTREMTSILRGRVDAGLRPSVIGEEAISYIADLGSG